MTCQVTGTVVAANAGVPVPGLTAWPLALVVRPVCFRPEATSASRWATWALVSSLPSLRLPPLATRAVLTGSACATQVWVLADWRGTEADEGEGDSPRLASASTPGSTRAVLRSAMSGPSAMRSRPPAGRWSAEANADCSCERAVFSLCPLRLVPRLGKDPLVSVLAVLRRAQALVDLLAHRADGELLGVASGHPDLAAQRDDRLPGQRALEDLLLAHVVREALMVTRLLDLLLDLLALEHGGRGGRPRRLRLRLERVAQRVVAHGPESKRPGMPGGRDGAATRLPRIV